MKRQNLEQTRQDPAELEPIQKNSAGFRGVTASDAGSRDKGLEALIRGAGDAVDEVVRSERRPKGIVEMERIGRIKFVTTLVVL